jgi:hypothetical protein
MEPSCLWLFDPWLIGPLAKFHLLIPPAKHTEQIQITIIDEVAEKSPQQQLKVTRQWVQS